MLAAVLLSPERSWTASEVAEAAHVSQPTATREVKRLSDTGVVTVTGSRNARQVSVDTAAVLYPDLASLVLKAFGPATVLAQELADLDGVEHVSVYGSGREAATPSCGAARRPSRARHRGPGRVTVDAALGPVGPTG